MIMMWFVTEAFEYAFHYASHKINFLWQVHKRHHLYSNPTPLAVFSDNPLDMWVKSSPVIWIPLLFPVLDITLFSWFSFISFVYGVYLHCGYEPTNIPGLPTPHSKYFISAWHHNIHHKKNIDGNYGLFTKTMDYIFNTVYDPQTPP